MFSSSDSDVSLQARKIIEFISYQTRKSSDVSTKFDSDLKSLSKQCDSKEFESKLELLGKYLGASSKRYDDNGDGPDVAWVFEEEDIAFAFEAKNEKLSDNPLTKQEHGQLQVAKEWLRAQYPKMKCFAISVHPNNLAYKNASAESALVLTLNKLNGLVKSIGQLIAILSHGTLNERGRLAECETLIDQHDLRPGQILETRVETFIAKEQG